MRRLTAIITILALIGSAAATPAIAPGATATPPRASPDFVISAPGQPTVPLSSLRGKVVVMEFLFVRSAHCMRIAQTLNKLRAELGLRGFESVAVVFDPPNTRVSGDQLIPLMQQSFKLTFPVGYASKAQVDSYLGRAQDQILAIPQLVVIDRAGRIRASSGGPGGNPALEDESSLRALIGELLDEHVSGS